MKKRFTEEQIIGFLLEVDAGCQSRIWVGQVAYQHATSLGGVELDVVIADYRAQNTAKDLLNR